MNDLITVAVSSFVGPFAAIYVTQWIDRKRRAHEGKVQILRMIVSSGHRNGIPEFSEAINMIPLEFNHDDDVMIALDVFLDSANSSEKDESLIRRTRIELTMTIAKHLRMRRLPVTHERVAYEAQSLNDRDKEYRQAVIDVSNMANAFREIAKHLSQQDFTDKTKVPASSADPTPVKPKTFMKEIDDVVFYQRDMTGSVFEG